MGRPELYLSIKKRANRVYYRSVKTAHESRLPQHAREKGHSWPKSKNKPKRNAFTKPEQKLSFSTLNSLGL
jgi:hypothetical protein